MEIIHPRLPRRKNVDESDLDRYLAAGWTPVDMEEAEPPEWGEGDDEE